MYMVVGFEVGPCSLKRPAGKPIESLDCTDDASKWQEIKEGETIVYSYDVYWQVRAGQMYWQVWPLAVKSPCIFGHR